jgi:hypothetical protein
MHVAGHAVASPRVCVCHRRDPTSSQPNLARVYKPVLGPTSRARPTTAELRHPSFAPPRWAHCSARFHGYLSTPKPSPWSHWTYTPACWPNRVACSLEPELPQPPPDRHRRASSSAGSPSPGTHLEPSPGHMEATRVTHCWAPPLFSPESELPRPRCHCSAASARRRHLRPSLRRQSISSESNRTPCPLICLTKPHLTAGESATAVGVRCGKPRAHLWTFKSSRGLSAYRFYSLCEF